MTVARAVRWRRQNSEASLLPRTLRLSSASLALIMMLGGWREGHRDAVFVQPL